MIKINLLTLSVFTAFMSQPLLANSTVQQQLDTYQQQGATVANVADGKALWYSDNDGRSCASCHGKTIFDEGAHVKTKKSIKPMAASINPKRYQKARKIEKWFLRNCKWTLGRVCNAQEKTNILTWLNSQ